MKDIKKYILITAAHNEEAKIEKTIFSVIKQKIKPLCWVIVNDRSTDNTEQLIDKYASKYDFIKKINTDGDGGHNFSAKVKALNRAIEFISRMNFDFIGILDADIRFDENYYESVISKFEEIPGLGIAGGQVYQEIGTALRKHDISLNTVSGGIQFFSKKCFQESCEFLPLKYGGEDAAVEILARKNKWIVQTFPEIRVFHDGCVGGASKNVFHDRFRKGLMFYQLGYHPVFQFSRFIFRIKESPFFIGAFMELSGFIFATFGNLKIQLSEDLVRYLRREQMNRIKKIKLLR